MIVYSATRAEFTRDVFSNQIEQKILDALTHRVGRSMVASWRNSIQYMNNVLLNPERPRALADRIIKNTYRTLMTRGQKGCYVFCVDEETNRYFADFTERLPLSETEYLKAAESDE